MTHGALLAGIAILCSACLLGPPVYMAEPIEGRVVDAETGQPIEGAVVVATWRTLRLGVDTHEGPTLKVLETTTDADGRYRLPGWGPRPRVPLTQVNPYSPRLTVFKSGYVPRSLSNDDETSGSSMARTSDWDGKTVKLEPFVGDVVEREFQLRTMGGSATGTCPPPSCSPLLVREVLNDESTFEHWSPRGQLLFEELSRSVEKGR